MKKEIPHEIEEQPLRRYASGGAAELLNSLQNRTHKVKGGAADQSTQGRIMFRDSTRTRSLKDEACLIGALEHKEK
jgi:hypothetical protein